MVLKSGLPYSKDIIPDFYEHGGIVDLSNAKFPTCKTVEENTKAIFVYLRNTGYNVTFDFSKMDYAQKSALLIEYLNTKVEYDIPELNTTWLCILYACVGLKITDVDCILNDLELICFQSEQFDYVKGIWEFVLSLPLFPVSRLDADFLTQPCNQTDKEFNLVNFYGLIKHDLFEGLYDQAGQIEPVFYTKVFTDENNKLFDAITHLPFMAAFNLLATVSVPEFKQLFEEATGLNVGD